VTSLDVSAPALEAAKRNFALNRDAAHGAANPGVEHAKHKVIADDAFTRLERLQREGERYSMVIADPPSFAKRKAETARALAAYARLTRLALDVLKPGGVLMMASCSSRVSTDAFYDTVTQTARNAGRPLVEIERTGHALDHPIGFPEGAYLKCLFATAAR
jgi:23S rRNA (cytosine1962-C5)-methyltransferase